jgi:predicted HAD superfamily Cof-like phosphohydrolase|tara:strand:+ start:3987 stop:4379 length:393 start_codon:yes stop_codon:yes gene_type:complete
MYQDDVELFMKQGLQDYPVVSCLDVPTITSDVDPQINLYMDLITEEYEELKEAYEQQDVVEVADALADMVWVIMGMASSLGMDFNDIWEEVKRSNMSKFTNNIIIRDGKTGKILKPSTFSEPDLAPILGL